MARPSKYETHVKPKLLLVQGWARDGLTDEQIAKNLGIAYSTFREYVKQYSALSATLQKGKEVIDFEVENALLDSALGFEYEEQVLTKDGDIVTLKKFQAPNTTAQIFWLKNRRPDKWRDRREVENSGSIEVKQDIMKQLSTEELKDFIKLAKDDG